MNGPALTGTVAWSDTDASGRYHFTSVFRWVENAEHAMYRTAVPDIDLGRFPRRAVSASFQRALVAGDEYAVHLDLTRIGTSSLTWRWRITSGDDTCVEGDHTAVHVDADGRPAPLPAPLQKALAGLTGGVSG